ncbi:pimeloyl-ACP methyl ester carboxylesterase [Sphingomonas zeicaulis]|uniref:alpha/beta fold hydrolase n=1 Tax=Sphingomonas zeicaulis TaxID=1632740 RepID=UPI003D20556B
MDVDGVRLHYVDQGNGPVVVLLHGNGVLLQDFIASGVLGLAAKHHRVIAFDRPGFGYSDRPRTTIWSPQAQADLLLRALQRIGVEHAVVVGHSWGTMVALAMALERPKAIDGLVLVSGYYFATARPDVVLLSAPAVPGAGDILAATISPIAGRLMGPIGVKASFAPAPVPKKFAAFPVDMTFRPTQVRATSAETAMMVPAAIALSRRYDELAMPIIAIAGDGDLIAHPSKHAERLAATYSTVELRTVAGQGHLLHYAVPEMVVTAIDAVLARAREHRIVAF